MTLHIILNSHCSEIIGAAFLKWSDAHVLPHCSEIIGAAFLKWCDAHVLPILYKLLAPFPTPMSVQVQ